jgi:hypothetical protein
MMAHISLNIIMEKKQRCSTIDGGGTAFMPTHFYLFSKIKIK